MSERARGSFAVAALVAAAAYYVWVLVHAGHAPNQPRSYDIYSYFYPIMVLTTRAFWNGGSGLFWNPYQDCGQPLFGDGTTGVLYPPAVGALVLPFDWALYFVLLFNLVVAAISTYYLCKQLGVGPAAAWCGALTFAFGTAMIDNLTFIPLVSGPYAWLPAAMLFCERILSRPTLRRAVALGVVIAVALMPGHPQAVFFAYQLIAARFLWELATNRKLVRLRTALILALGLALGPLFAAVQLVPYVEVMRNSIRNATLNLAEIHPSGYLSWTFMRRQFLLRSELYNPFMLVPYVLGSAALLNAPRRRHVAFYLLAGLLYLDLALGTNGFLFKWYIKLPFGALFRDPGRFIWVTVFCLAPLVGFGVDAILGRAAPSGVARRAGLVLLTASTALAFSRIPLHGGLSYREWGVAATCVVGALLVWLVPRARAVAALAIAGALLLNLVVWRPIPFRKLLPSGDFLFARAALYDALRARMTPHDRTYLSVPHADFSMQQKTGALFGVPSLFDYESQPTRRYASYFNMLRTGAALRGLNDWLYPVSGFMTPGLQRRLLDLAAARYLLVGAADDRSGSLQPPVTPVLTFDNIRVYENTQALPRAFYVPRIEVISDPEAILRRLAKGDDDLRQVAFVEDAIASRFTGTATSEPSSADFVRNDPEHLEIRVHAPQRGFLFLADQYYDGWRASVNGTAAPIHRANYAFRLIEVPAGDSVVELRYRPRSVAIGALITLATCVGAGVAFSLSHRERRR